MRRSGIKRAVALCLVLMTAVSLLSASDWEERLARLDAHLSAIKDESFFTRNISGGILAAGGGLMVAVSAFYAINAKPLDIFGTYVDLKPLYLFGVIGGASFAVPGVLLLAIKPETESLPERFAAIVATDAETAAWKIASGEAYLGSLAKKERDKRLIGGGIGLALGFLSLYLNGIFDPLLPDSLKIQSDYLYGDIYSGQRDYSIGLSMIASGLGSMILKSRAEREFESYEAWRESYR